jgi:hypothetical protein
LRRGKEVFPSITSSINAGYGGDLLAILAWGNSAFRELILNIG